MLSEVKVFSLRLWKQKRHYFICNQKNLVCTKFGQTLKIEEESKKCHQM